MNGHNTSVFIEAEFWQELKLISKKEAKSLTVIISNIDKNKKTQNQTRLKRERCRRAAGESRAAVKCRHGRPLLPPRGGTLLCNISLLAPSGALIAIPTY